jgi:divalent metal cation (Fe/Co/Zn/Cd) transporter
MRKEIKILAYFFGTIIILFGALFLSEAAFEFGSPDKVQFITWYPIVGIAIIIIGILVFYAVHRGDRKAPSLD